MFPFILIIIFCINSFIFSERLNSFNVPTASFSAPPGGSRACRHWVRQPHPQHLFFKVTCSIFVNNFSMCICSEWKINHGDATAVVLLFFTKSIRAFQTLTPLTLAFWMMVTESRKEAAQPSLGIFELQRLQVEHSWPITVKLSPLVPPASG